jgi:hypothetical protein
LICISETPENRGGEEGEFLSTNQDEGVLRGEGVLDELSLNKRFYRAVFHPAKAQDAQEIHFCPKVRGLQNSNVNAVG